MNAKAKLLKRHPVFGRLSMRTLRKLTAHAVIERRARGEVIYRAGEPGDALYLVLTGRCQSSLVLADGPEHGLHIFGPGDTFGERALLSGDAHWSTVRVITDCVLLRLAGDDVRSLMGRNPEVAQHFAQRMCSQLRVYREEPSRLPSGRIATFAAVSPAVNGAFITDAIAYGLKQETGAAVLSVHVHAGDDRLTLQAWRPSSGPDANGFDVGEFLERAQDGWDRLRVGTEGSENETPGIASLVSHLARLYRHVIVHLGHDVSEAVVLEFLTQSDLTYALLQQSTEDVYRTNLLVRQYQDHTSGEWGELWPVICLKDDERASPFEAYRRQLGVAAHAVVHALPGAQAREFVFEPALFKTRFGVHVRRLEREIGRCRIGLALSSGGAKALAHVGVIQVLEENDIHVDVVAGTSMGAYIGALWAYGHGGEELERLALRMERRGALVRLVDPALPPRRGFIRGNRIKRLLEKSIGEAHFSDLMRQLRVVATDLDTLDRVAFESGRISNAVLASMAIPGVIVPVEHEGRNLVDGGIADPLPVGVLMEMGVERIIAVNTIPHPEEIREYVRIGRERDAAPKDRRHLIPAVYRRINYFARGNILDILIRSMDAAATRVAEGASRQADIVLRPVSCDGVWLDFSRARNYIELGRRAAEAQLDELKELAAPLRPSDQASTQEHVRA